MYPDRLGSIGKYYPYGIERPSATTNDTEKFTGYFRDAETGNDYAVNRYQSPGYGRFLTPDPYMANSGGEEDPADPGSWNKYAYVEGDPVNDTDEEGLYGDTCDGTTPSPNPNPGPGPLPPVGYPDPGPDLKFRGGAICRNHGLLLGPARSSAQGVPIVAKAPFGFQAALDAAWKQVWNDLENPKCDSVFGPNFTPAQLQADLKAAKYVWGTCTGSAAGGSACTCPPSAQAACPSGGAAPNTVTFNTNGPLNINNVGGTYATLQLKVPNGNITLNGGVADLTFVLLHELAHLTGQGTIIDNVPTVNTGIFNNCMQGQTQ